ncbi:hypothetical protein BH11BAC2_BH11BAC2_07710 [soil metagenome]
MTSPAQATDKLDAIRLLKILSKWKKQLLYVFIGAVVVSIIITMPVFMKPMFKATAIIYPVNLQPYSKETPTEQLVQLLNSEEVRDQLIRSFDLYKHYEIDPKGNYPRFEIMKRLDENISIEKTEYESVEINVFDTDPKKAALMADSISGFLDAKAISLLRERSAEIAVIMYNQFINKKHEMDSLENRLVELRTRYGLLDFENQVQGFSREYYRASSGGGANSRMEQALKNLEMYGGEYTNISSLLIGIRKEYGDFKYKYELALTDQKKVLTFHNVITKPSIPERKDSPKRTLIILLFSVSAMFIALLVIIYQEHFRKQLASELEA